MDKINPLEMTPDELRTTAIMQRKNGKIFLIIGICTLPFFIGILFLLLSVMFYSAAKSYIKRADSKERELNTPITRYVIFDFETNGLSPKTNRVIEVGALKIENGEVVDKFSTLVNPQRNLTKRITDLTGITSEMLIDAPLEIDVFKEFADFAKGYILTAYNVNFDIGFLDETLKRLGIPFGSVEYFDTMKIARQNFKNVENYKLETIMQSLNPDYIQNHRALDDCYAVKTILDRITLTREVLL